MFVTRTLAPEQLVRRWLGARSAVGPTGDELQADAAEARRLGFVDHVGPRQQARAFAAWLAHVPGAESPSPRRVALALRGEVPGTAEATRLLREYGAAIADRERAKSSGEVRP